MFLFGVFKLELGGKYPLEVLTTFSASETTNIDSFTGLQHEAQLGFWGGRKSIIARSSNKVRTGVLHSGAHLIAPHNYELKAPAGFWAIVVGFNW